MFSKIATAMIQRVSSTPFLGPALRKWAQSYPEGSVVTIKVGLAAGMKWKRHHRYVNGYWVGHYELEIQRALQRIIHPGDVFYDVGANAGFFSLIAAKLVGGGRVYSFDPLEKNIQSIREQMEVNHQTNCETFQLAVADQDGTATFSGDENASAVARIGEPKRETEQRIQVRTVSLDSFAAQHTYPTVLKIDVEGAEGLVVQGAQKVIAAGAVFLFELHNPKVAFEVTRHMIERNYQWELLDGQLTQEPEKHRHVIARPRSSQ